MTVLLLFSSPHSFSVGFRSEDRDSNGKRFILCSVTHFCVYFDVCFGLLSCWKIKTWPIRRFLTEAVRFRFFICWYLIESMMPCIWTRCPGPPAEKQAHNIKDPAVYLTVDMGYFLSLFILNSSGGVAAKKLFFQFHLTIEASAIWSSSLVWQLNLLEFVFGWVRRIFLETLPNNMWWFRGCFFIFFLGFWPQDEFSSCDRWRVFGYSNSPPQHSLGRYRHTSSFRQIKIFSWLEPLNYYPDGGNGDFQCFNSFLTVTF